MGRGTEKYAGKISRSLDFRTISICPVSRFSVAIEGTPVGEPPRNTAWPGAARRYCMSVNGESTSINFRVLEFKVASREIPCSIWLQTIKSVEANAYDDIPNSHLGIPSSPFVSQTL